MLRNGVIPIPPARNMAGFAKFLCNMKVPAAGPIFTSAVNGTRFSERLKAVSRIRVVNTNSFAKGGLAIENVRVFSPGVSFRWVGECHIGKLARSEAESGWLLEVKGHCT